MLVHVGPGLLRVPGETQFVHNYIAATRGGSVKLSEGSSPQAGYGAFHRLRKRQTGHGQGTEPTPKV
jgi:hypothetical protein